MSFCSVAETAWANGGSRLMNHSEFPASEKITRIRHQYDRSYSAFSLALEARETGDPEREKEGLETAMKAITTRNQLFFLMYQRHNDLTAQSNDLADGLRQFFDRHIPHRDLDWS